MPTTTPFNNLITFSRGSNATVTGSNGLIQWAPNNLLTFSEQFDNAAWTKNNGTVAANVTAAPDGTTTADKFVENTSSASHFIIQSATTIATSYTFSVYAKAAGRTFVLVYHDQSNSGAVFNLTNGAITTPSGIPLAAASVTDAGNGWYRCAITVTATAASNGFRAQLGDSATNYVYTGDGTSGIFLWGAQLELGSTATTYNSTTVKNLLGFSEAFDNAAWTKVAASIVTGAQANPINGLFNAQKFMEGTANAQYAVFRSVAVGTAPHTFSMYAKLAPGTPRFFCLYPQGAGVAWAIFDLALGTTTAVSAINYISSSITPVGSGWYRCSITLNTTASNLFCNAYLTNSSGTPAPSYTGDGNSGVYIYGAQLSDSASLDPYVPTPGAAPSSTAFYGPRFDFDPVTRAPRGILIEEQRTNLQIRSEEFNGAPWTPTNLSVITANSSTAPDGTMTADLLVSAVGAGVTGIVVTSVTFSALTYTQSVFVKAATGVRYIQLLWASGVTSSDYANFDLQTGAVTGGVYSSASMTNFGNGWYRVSLTSVAGASTSGMWIAAVPSGTSVRAAAYTGNGTDSILIWGAQLEAGAFATSYIPTVASTVTRSADVATITGQNFAQWFRQPEGTFVVEATTSGQQYSGYYNLTGGIEQQAYDNGAVNVAAKYGAVTLSFNLTGNKFATAYGASGTAGFSSGNSMTNATAFTSTATGMEMGLSTFPRRLNGHIRNIRFIPARAADFQLQALST